MFSVLVIRLRSLRLLRVSGIVMRLRMFLLLITFLKASHSFRNRLLVICKNAYLFATMIMTSVSSPFSCCSGIVRFDVLAAQPVTTNLLKFMRASIKMIGVSNLQSFIASMTQKLTLSDISDESKNYLDKAGITTACLRIKSKWTAGGK